MATTSIEWTRGDDGTAGVVWNPTTGCDWASKGCDHCYAMTWAKRLKGMGSSKYQNDGDPRTSGPGFGLTMHPAVLTEPLSWRKGVRVFSNSMSDLFHPKVTDDFIAQTFAVMALGGRHTFKVLTKRPPRMASLLNRPDFRAAVAEHASDLIGSRAWRHWQLDLGGQRLAGDSGIGSGWTAERAGPTERVGVLEIQNTLWTPPWPLPNVWLGTSVEDQDAAKARLPHLRKTPAAVLWVSAEPLVGPLDLGLVLPISWVVVGGESGGGARAMEAEWMTSIRDQCDAAGVAFYLKQAGDVLAKQWGCRDRHGRTPAEWPEQYPRELPDGKGAVV